MVCFSGFVPSVPSQQHGSVEWDTMAVHSLMPFEILWAKGLLPRTTHFSARDEWYDCHETIQPRFPAVFFDTTLG